MGPAEDDQLNLQVEPESLTECVIAAWRHTTSRIPTEFLMFEDTFQKLESPAECLPFEDMNQELESSDEMQDNRRYGTGITYRMFGVWRYGTGIGYGMFDVSSEVSAYDPVTGIVYGMCDVSSEVSAYDSVIGIS